ncbi:hypothetical protein CQW23_05876 [Capsicum baccatum]|uniref:Disease resistance R13L4/SHOC-2-like LRR domain-containing protein n=1 Tax=Capsicum baccatum TaxID=33114 RepID=A0A2G2VJF4_CAPBA|nr:hypothetical protein CQW23_29434 [Capsicum baccatum]PHT57390.1 hypothetical protein CQW23_05876 [Capsicum baccatum]
MMMVSKIFSLLQFFNFFTITFASTEEATALLKWKSTLKNQNNSGNQVLMHAATGTEFHALMVGVNNLSGTIPPEIGNLTNLIYLDLSMNQISGTIPPEIGKMMSLLNLSIHTNNLYGLIPKTIGELTELKVLHLYANQLSGSIPRKILQCLGNITALQFMMMSHNKLSGQLPPSICNLTLLKVPDLGRNNLMGAIPQCFGNISSHLEVLDMQHNNLSSTLPTTFSIGSALGSFNLHGNELEGKIPRSLENCKLLEVVDFGDNLLNDTFPMLLNKLHGHIPSIIGDLIALRILNLSHNGLQGHIPRSLGSLSSVESLDLSGNHLVGEIPAQFASLTSLEVLNLSNNHLEGCIPQGNQFHTFENNSYEGNDGLRGFPLSKGCGNDGDDSISEETYAGPALDEESNSEFLNDFWKAALMGYGTGLCIGLSIIYFLISTGNMKWLERIVEELEHKIMMARRKKQRRQTYRYSS